MGGEAKAYVAAASCCNRGVWVNLVYCEGGSIVANDENDVVAIEGVAVDPNDSDRFISGGDRSEETEICFAGVLSCELFAMMKAVGQCE